MINDSSLIGSGPINVADQTHIEVNNSVILGSRTDEDIIVHDQATIDYQGTTGTGGYTDAWIRLLSKREIYVNAQVATVVATGIGEINRQSLTLFPNPADQEIQITSKHVIDEVILLDLIGNRVLRQPVNNAKMRLGTSDISNGIYLLQVSTNDQVLVEKITIKH